MDNKMPVYRHKSLSPSALLLLLGLVGIITLVPDYAYAFAAAESTVNKVLRWLTGPFGMSVAALIIAGAGYGAYMGKLTFKVALNIAIGVLLVFGAPGILRFIIS